MRVYRLTRLSDKTTTVFQAFDERHARSQAFHADQGLHGWEWNDPTACVAELIWSEGDEKA